MLPWRVVFLAFFECRPSLLASENNGRWRWIRRDRRNRPATFPHLSHASVLPQPHYHKVDGRISGRAKRSNPPVPLVPRSARIVAVNSPHHITQRGNRRRVIFYSDSDRAVYLQLLREQAGLCGLTIVGFCLMSNHVDIIAVPSRPDSLALTFRYTHGRYATYLNSLQAQSGHVWQGRFYSCPLDTAHAWSTLRYLELNTVRAGIVAAPEHWPWSSTSAHLSTSEVDGLSLKLWRTIWNPKRWRTFLNQGVSRMAAAEIRRNTHNGFPLVSAAFIRSLEQKLNRRITDQYALRPPRHLSDNQVGSGCESSFRLLHASNRWSIRK